MYLLFFMTNQVKELLEWLNGKVVLFNCEPHLVDKNDGRWFFRYEWESNESGYTPVAEIKMLKDTIRFEISDVFRIADDCYGLNVTNLSSYEIVSAIPKRLKLLLAIEDGLSDSERSYLAKLKQKSYLTEDEKKIKNGISQRAYAFQLKAYEEMKTAWNKENERAWDVDLF